MQYELKGGAFPVVVCQLADGEKMITEKGSMVWMTPNMQMETTGGGLGKMFSKAFSGESMFQNIYTARGAGMIAFGSSFPGRILALEVDAGHEFILQKTAFLASEAGVQLSIHFNSTAGEASVLILSSGRIERQPFVFPCDQIPAHRMSPVHGAPAGSIGKILIKQMVVSFVVYKAVGIVYPVIRRFQV